MGALTWGGFAVPISPALLHDGLLAFIIRKSPKHADLIRDGRFALHSFRYPLSREFGDEEFYAAGVALLREDAALRQGVTALTRDDPHLGDAFELRLERVLLKLRRPNSPLYTTWRAT